MTVIRTNVTAKAKKERMMAAIRTSVETDDPVYNLNEWPIQINMHQDFQSLCIYYNYIRTPHVVPGNDGLLTVTVAVMVTVKACTDVTVTVVEACTDVAIV